MSGRTSSEADGAGMDGSVEQLIRSRVDQFAERGALPVRARQHQERTTEESPKDLSGRVLARLEFQFADLFG